MIDLTGEMADLMSALGRPQGRSGRVLMFVCAYNGEGVSTVAREYARCEAAFAARPVWLVDADFGAQSQMLALTSDVPRFGPPGPLSQASPDGSCFFQVTPQGRDAAGEPLSDASYLVARPFLDQKLWVTRIREQTLTPGQRLRASESPAYWQALRRHAQTIAIDAPAVERSRTALQIAPFVDGIVMVVSEDDHDIEARVSLRADLEQAGGRVVGMVYNRARGLKGTVRPATRRVATP